VPSKYSLVNYRNLRKAATDIEAKSSQQASSG
jgi:hypothetical protein